MNFFPLVGPQNRIIYLSRVLFSPFPSFHLQQQILQQRLFVNFTSTTNMYNQFIKPNPIMHKNTNITEQGKTPLPGTTATAKKHQGPKQPMVGIIIPAISNKVFWYDGVRTVKAS